MNCINPEPLLVYWPDENEIRNLRFLNQKEPVRIEVVKPTDKEGLNMIHSFGIPGLNRTFVVPALTPPVASYGDDGGGPIRRDKRKKAQEKKRWAKIRRKQGRA